MTTFSRGIPDWSPLKQGVLIIGRPRRPESSTKNLDAPKPPTEPVSDTAKDEIDPMQGAIDGIEAFLQRKYEEVMAKRQANTPSAPSAPTTPGNDDQA